MSYVDVETSAEAIKEDEELIEAVEQIVGKASKAIIEDVKNDVSGFYFQARLFFDNLFPFLVYWREDRSLFWDDMGKLALSGALFLVVFWILAPSPQWVKKSSSWLSFRKNRGRVSAKRSSSLEHMKFKYLRSLSPFCKGKSKPALERSRSTSNIDYKLGLSPAEIIEEEDRETEEEKFLKRWPSILESKYSFLVLPPECKRMEKPKRQLEIGKEAKEKENNEKLAEDHPFNRLIAYRRQFLHLMITFLRYDYNGAGLALINWTEALLKTRQNRGEPEDEDDDDQSEAGSLKASVISSEKSEKGPVKLTPEKAGLRSKRDTTMKLQKTDQLWSDAVAPDIGESSSDLSSQTHLGLSLEPSMINESEEKKESPMDQTGNVVGSPPRTPRPFLSRPSSPSSIYETPGLDASDKRELDPGEILATRVISSKSLFVGTAKRKDSLEQYRNPISRKGLPPLPPTPARRQEIKHTQPNSPPPFPEPRIVDRNEVSESFYFETVSTKESLRKMAVEVPVPDRNGYVLGDEFLPDNNWTPLLVFVNSRSGPQQGHLLITQLRGLLNPIQVWDLADGDPEEILESFSALTRLRILVCGGDGTVSWIVNCVEKMGLQRWPPIAILPLGTGNDLARIHGWGGGYNNESLIGILEQVTESYISWLDRWEMTVENKKGTVKKVKSFFNYLGVGADAQSALQVHMLRESRPDLFFSRALNKAWYALFGAEDVIKATSVNLPHEITLIADGVEVPLPPDSQGIILLNIDSYAGGTSLWSQSTKAGVSRGRTYELDAIPLKRSRSLDAIRGPKRKSENQNMSMRETGMDRIDSAEDIASMGLSDEEKYLRVTACELPSSCQDGFLDVVSIRGTFHLGQIRVGLSHAQKLCQCREAKIIIKRKTSVQIDGEPWRQNHCTLHVKRKKDAAIMLHRSADDSNGVETEMAKLLDWAEERDLIDNRVHGALMKEFSRRIESKTRQRRVQSQDNLVRSFKRAMGSSGNLQKGGRKSPLMF